MTPILGLGGPKRGVTIMIRINRSSGISAFLITNCPYCNVNRRKSNGVFYFFVVGACMLVGLDAIAPVPNWE
jgi:hypothetical protein